MRLIRHAILSTSEQWLPVGQEMAATRGEVQISARHANIDGPGFGALLAASVNIRRPSINRERRVAVPRRARRSLEDAIEYLADLAALSTRSTRHLSSPHPALALSHLTPRDREYLSQAKGFAYPRLPIRNRMVERIEMRDQALEGLAADRRDGVVLLAEALSAVGHVTGQFHEYLRVFERGFKLGPTGLIDPLARFLRGARGLGYTKKEITHWLLDLRGPATHADRRQDFALASDIEPVIWRVEQAAYDVLLNKKNWRSPDAERRKTYLWTSGLSRKGVFVTQGHLPTITGAPSDPFGAYPLYLGSFESGDDLWTGETVHENES
jgi:hypothetical protein